jgi:serine/threonine-protein kinase
VVQQLEAWMPERIAVVKLRGFVHDMSGEVVESLPGLVRVRLPIPGTAVAPPPSGIWTRLGFARPVPAAPRCLLLEMHLAKKQADHFVLQVSAIMRPEKETGAAPTPGWRDFAARVARELRAYLIGTR